MSATADWTKEDVLLQANWGRMCRAMAWFDREEDAPVLDHRAVGTVPVRFLMRGMPSGYLCFIYPDLRRRVWVRRTSKRGLVLDGQYTYYRGLPAALEAGVKWKEKVLKELAKSENDDLQQMPFRRD